MKMTSDEAMLRALILARFVHEDRVDAIVTRLRGRLIPPDPAEILTQLDAAIMADLDERIAELHPSVVWVGPNRPPELCDEDDWIQTQGSEETP